MYSTAHMTGKEFRIGWNNLFFFSSPYPILSFADHTPPIERIVYHQSQICHKTIVYVVMKITFFSLWYFQKISSQKTLLLGSVSSAVPLGGRSKTTSHQVHSFCSSNALNPNGWSANIQCSYQLFTTQNLS